MTNKLMRKHVTPEMLELYKLLLKSEKFLNWEPESADDEAPLTADDIAQSHISVDDPHYTPKQLAEAWGVDVETVRNIFRDEPGVLKISNGSKLRTTLRIPKEVAERVHRRLAA